VPNQFVLSGEYSRGGLRLSVEHAQLHTEGSTTLSGTPFPAPPATETKAAPVSTYGQAAYRVNEHFQASGYYSVSYADRDDKEGSSLVQRGQPAHAGWVKDLAFTGRVDVNAHWLFKAEVHRFDGTYNLSAAENPAGLEKDWTLFVVKTTLHF
jgi:hypothetical protein